MHLQQVVDLDSLRIVLLPDEGRAASLRQVKREWDFVHFGGLENLRHHLREISLDVNSFQVKMRGFGADLIGFKMERETADLELTLDFEEYFASDWLRADLLAVVKSERKIEEGVASAHLFLAHTWFS